MARSIILDNIEIEHGGGVAANFTKLDDGVAPPFVEAHRVNLGPDDDVAGFMEHVNRQMVRLGWPEISAQDIAQIEAASAAAPHA